MTRLSAALETELKNQSLPFYTNYQLFLILRTLFHSGTIKYLRGDKPTVDLYKRTRKTLAKRKILDNDTDYHSCYRVITKGDLPADEIVCLADPFCYISHLSAMQKFGLTDRRPKSLHITTPSQSIKKEMISKKMNADYEGKLQKLNEDEYVKLTTPKHPEYVRGREIHAFATVHFGDFISQRGTYARLSTIGQTFLDMLEQPSLCGGIAHVLDVWRENASIYQKEIIKAINSAPKDIHKVRAGYIFDEYLGIKNNEIDAWQKYAQRGGSRVLDPSTPYRDVYSEKWKISINV